MVGEAVDNADVKADGKMHTKLACSSTYLGWNMTAQNVALLKAQKRSLLPKPNASTVQRAALTTGDDEAIANMARLCDMQALEYAYGQLLEESLGDNGTHTQLRQPPAAVSVRERVQFTDGNGNHHEGEVTAVNSNEGSAEVSIQHGSGLVEVCKCRLARLKKLTATRDVVDALPPSQKRARKEQVRETRGNETDAI